MREFRWRGAAEIGSRCRAPIPRSGHLVRKALNACYNTLSRSLASPVVRSLHSRLVGPCAGTPHTHAPLAPAHAKRPSRKSACDAVSEAADDVFDGVRAAQGSSAPTTSSSSAAAAGDSPSYVRPRATDDAARSRATTRRVNEPKPVLRAAERRRRRRRQRRIEVASTTASSRSTGDGRQARPPPAAAPAAAPLPATAELRNENAAVVCPAQRRAGPTRKVLHQPSTVPAFLLHEPVEPVELLSAPTRLPGRRCGGDGGAFAIIGRVDSMLASKIGCLQAGESSGLSCLQTRIEIECASARGERGGTCRGEGA